MATKAKNALISAFLKLIEEYEFDKITVTNLVEVCGISRQTFYYHFDDIDKMLEWAFENETKVICDAIGSAKTSELAELYAAFLKKYDTLLVKASRSDSFVNIYLLINDSFRTFINEYVFGKNSKEKRESEDKEFFISYCASAFAGLVTQEVLKEERDYGELIKKLFKSIKTAE